MFRSTQLISNYVMRRGRTSSGVSGAGMVGKALCNLGEEVTLDHQEVHAFFHMINGNVKLRGMAYEQVDSTDINVAVKAKDAIEFARVARTHEDAERVLIDEDGNVVEEMAGLLAGTTAKSPHEKLQHDVKDVHDELNEFRDETRKQLVGITYQMDLVIKTMKEAQQQQQQQLSALPRRRIVRKKTNSAISPGQQTADGASQQGGAAAGAPARSPGMGRSPAGGRSGSCRILAGNGTIPPFTGASRRGSAASPVAPPGSSAANLLAPNGSAQPQGGISRMSMPEPRTAHLEVQLPSAVPANTSGSLEA